MAKKEVRIVINPELLKESKQNLSRLRKGSRDNTERPKTDRMSVPPVGFYDFIKLIVPASMVLLLHGLLPLYAVFLSYAAFYPVCALLIDLISGAKKIKQLRLDEKAYMYLAALVVLLGMRAFYVPSFAFFVAYLPYAIAALVCFEFVVLAVTMFNNLINLDESGDIFGINNKNYDFFLISIVTAMTAVMFGSGVLVEANFLLAAALIAIVLLSTLFCKAEPAEGKAGIVKTVLDWLLVVFFNPVSTVALAIIFGLSGFGFLPVLALTNPVFAAIWVVFVPFASSCVFLINIFACNNAKNQAYLIAFFIVVLFILLPAGLSYAIASFVVNLGAGSVASLYLGLSSPVLWPLTIAFFSAILSIVRFHKALAFNYLKNGADQAKAIVNSVIWSAVVYGVASYIMAPAGTMFVAMLGANAAIALPLALVVYAVAAIVVKYGLFNAKAKRADTFKFFNTENSKYKAVIVVASVLTLIVGLILAFSGMAIFATSIMQAFVMQALTVATSVIVAATVWRTLDKAFYNEAIKAPANKDSLGMIALKALGVILFAAVGYSLAAILPMFAGLILPTWSALASAFAVLSVLGVFTATLAAAYATNIASFYVSPKNLDASPRRYAESLDKKTVDDNSHLNQSETDLLEETRSKQGDQITAAENERKNMTNDAKLQKTPREARKVGEFVNHIPFKHVNRADLRRALVDKKNYINTEYPDIVIEAESCESSYNITFNIDMKPVAIVRMSQNTVTIKAVTKKILNHITVVVQKKVRFLTLNSIKQAVRPTPISAIQEPAIASTPSEVAITTPEAKTLTSSN